MREERGSIWSKHEQGNYIIIPTNGIVNKDGKAVMGRGLAKQATERYPLIARRFGTSLKVWGNIVTYLSDKIIVFPVKHHWRDDADLTLIRRSAEQLNMFVDFMGYENVYLPRVGCGNGRLSWSDVEPVLSEVLDNKFVVVYPGDVIASSTSDDEDQGIEL